MYVYLVVINFRAGLASVCGRVYTVGGFNGSLRVRTVDLYEPNLDQWFSAPDMESRYECYTVYKYKLAKYFQVILI